MKRVVLVKPSETSRFNFGAFSLGVLAASVRDLAQVSILDATRMTVDRAVRRVRSLNPDLVGVTAMGIASVPAVAAFFTALRAAESHPRYTILAGGHGASMLPAALLTAGADAVVIGEGELTLQEILVSGIRPGMQGLACLVDGEVVVGPLRPPIRPLDRLSLPARDLMPPPPDGVHLMETSRGCPHECSFCEATRFYGNKWRPYSPARVAEQLQGLVRDYDAWTVHLADDNFAASPRRVLEICEALKHGPRPACILASARADDLLQDPSLIPAMAEARILRLGVGVETVDRQLAAQVGKPIPGEVYQEAFQHMREHGIFSVASFIVGLPGETPQIRERTVELAVQIAPDSAHFLPFFPLPGIPLASHRTGLDPDPVDVRDAERFTQTFYQHPLVRRRLEETLTQGGIRALLARATLERQTRAEKSGAAGTRRRPRIRTASETV